MTPERGSPPQRFAAVGGAATGLFAGGYWAAGGRKRQATSR